MFIYLLGIIFPNFSDYSISSMPFMISSSSVHLVPREIVRQTKEDSKTNYYSQMDAM
jgi:hypothetical protein